MAHRLNGKVPFHVLPRDSPGDDEPLSKSPTTIEGKAGNARRRRKKKTRSSSSLNPRPQLDVLSDDRPLLASSSITNPSGEILRSHRKALSEHFPHGFEQRDDISPFSDDRLVTNTVNQQPFNGSLPSSMKSRDDDDVRLSQLGFLPACNGSSKSIPSEEFQNSRTSCVSGSAGDRVSDSTCGNDKENDLLQSIKIQQVNNALESPGVSSTALPQDEARNLNSLTSLDFESLGNSGCSGVDRVAFCGNKSTGEDPVSSKRKESMDETRSELKRPTPDSMEEDTSASQRKHVQESALLRNGTMPKAVSEYPTVKNNKVRNQAAERYNQNPKLPPRIPIAHVETPQLLDWEQLMAANSSCSQSANLSPLQYFLREVMRSDTPLDTQSAENEKKRQHVYNTMFHVPWRCELLIVVGFFVCMDSFLSLLTVTPLRTIMYLWGRFVNGRQFRRPHAGELADMGCLLVLVTGVTLLLQADISYIYHMIRGQATIKLYVVYNVLEIFDKLCQSFGSDVFQVVLNSAESVATCSSDQLLFESFRFAMDQCIALISFIVHSLIILAEAITVSAALRSHNSALLTLLISNNFAEIKSNVFKRLGKDNLLKLAYLDVVERFHIVAHLFFVLAQNLSAAANEPWLLAFASNASMVLLCEILVDVIKHAFLAKFNEIKPAAYSEFLQALCKQTLASRSDDVHKTMAFVPLAPACVVIRVLIPLYTAYIPGAPLWQLSGMVLGGIVTYILLVMLKIIVGLGLLKHANWYVERCKKKEKYFHFD